MITVYDVADRLPKEVVPEVITRSSILGALSLLKRKTAEQEAAMGELIEVLENALESWRLGYSISEDGDVYYKAIETIERYKNS